MNQAYRQAGMRGYWEKQLEQRQAQSNEGEYPDPFWIARDYALVEDDGQAFEWLERAYKEGSNWMPVVAVEHGFSRLQSDPRFAALLRKMGLEMPVGKK